MFSGGDVSPKVRTALLDALNPTAKKLSVETLDPTPIKNLSDIEDGEALVHYQTIEETPVCYDPSLGVPLDTVLADPVTIKWIPAGGDLGHKKDSYITVSSKKPIEPGSNLERYVHDVPADKPEFYQNLQATFFAANMSEVVKKYSKTANESPEGFAGLVKTGEIDVYNGVCRNNQPNPTTKEVEVYFHKGNKVLNRRETNGLKPVDLPKGVYLQDFDKIQILVECQYGDRESAFDGDGKLFLPLNLRKADKCKETIAKLFGNGVPATVALQEGIDESVAQLREEWGMKVEQFERAKMDSRVNKGFMTALVFAQVPMVYVTAGQAINQWRQRQPILPTLQDLIALAKEGKIIRPSSHLDPLLYEIVSRINIPKGENPIVTFEFAGGGKSLSQNGIAYLFVDNVMPRGEPLAQFAPNVARSPIFPRLNPGDISSTEGGEFLGIMARRAKKFREEVKAKGGFAAIDETADFADVGKTRQSGGVIGDFKGDEDFRFVGSAVEKDYDAKIGSDPQLARRMPKLRGEDFGMKLTPAQVKEAMKEADKPGKPKLYHQAMLGRQISDGAIDRIVDAAAARKDGAALAAEAKNLLYKVAADMNGRQIPGEIAETHVTDYLSRMAQESVKSEVQRVISAMDAEQKGITPEVIFNRQFGSIHAYLVGKQPAFTALSGDIQDQIIHAILEMWNGVTNETRDAYRVSGTPEHHVSPKFIEMAVKMVDNEGWQVLLNQQNRPPVGPQGPQGPSGPSGSGGGGGPHVGGGQPPSAPTGGAPAGGTPVTAGPAPALASPGVGPTVAPRSALRMRANFLARALSTPFAATAASAPFALWSMLAHPDINVVSKKTHDIGLGSVLGGSLVFDFTILPTIALYAYPFTIGQELAQMTLDKTGIEGLQKGSAVSTGAGILGGGLGAALSSQVYAVARNATVQVLQADGMLQGVAAQLKAGQAVHELSKLVLRPADFALRGMGHGPALTYLANWQAGLRITTVDIISTVKNNGQQAITSGVVHTVRAVGAGLSQRKAALAGVTAGAGGIASFARVALPVARAFLAGSSASASASAVATTLTTAAVEATVAVEATATVTTVTGVATIGAGTLVASALAVASAGAAGYGVGTVGMDALDDFSQEKRLGSAMDLGSYEIPSAAPEKYKRGNWKFTKDE